MRITLLLLAINVLGLLGLRGQDHPDLYDVDVIQDIRINFPQDDWRYYLDSLRVNGDELHLGRVLINDVGFDKVGIRFRDGITHTPGEGRNGLHIELDYIDRNKNYAGYHVLNLSSALRDPSLVREVLGLEVARDYMPASRANYAKVYINEEYFGLFINLEYLDHPFLEHHFGESEGSLFLASPAKPENNSGDCVDRLHGTLQYAREVDCYLTHFTLLSDKGWDDLIELTRVLHEEPEKLETVLDIDRTLWMMAFNNLTVNLSSYLGRYSDNYYLYKHSEGHFIPGIWDLNLAFGSYKNTGKGSDLRTSQLIKLDPMLHADNPAKPLVNKLLSREEYRKLYLSHYRTIFEDHFRNGRYAERAQKFQALIRDAFKEDPHAYYDVADFDRSLDETIGNRSRIPGLVSFMEQRVDYLKRSDYFTVVPPDIVEVDVKKRERFARDMLKDFQISAVVEHKTGSVRIHYRFAEDQPFQTALMEDDGEHGDGEANDQRYGVKITPPEGKEAIEYYITAENSYSISFSPRRYMYKLHSHTLNEIN